MYNKFYAQLADAMKTTIKESYPEKDESDAGADFANGYNVQISRYLPQSYSLWYEGKDENGEEVFRMVHSTKTQKAMVEFVQKMAFKYEMGIKEDGGVKWYQNAVVLATRAEADRAGRDKFMAWFVPVGYRVVESDETVNYTCNLETGELTSV